ncbi:FUSC family protein [Phyllobacterium leguminum]|uniref:Fusaric acid resistance family protein n=1 Tax=Phyllobacterium leguminum TaxID=314237 RepID=A0A318T940_9HYPH|nr:FUSC family protein [Phyllobacterium leguminum]PYE87203.1 fusaric acid resistance family protein [Phyllobacterium leguminum]
MLDFIERLLASLEAEWRALSFSIAHAHVHTAIRGTLAALLAILLALWLRLDNPWWAGITALVIGQSDVAATLARSLDRALGTIIGAFAGYAGAALVAHHFMFELTCAAATAVSLYGFERARHGYAFLLGGVTTLVIMFGSLNTPDAAIDFAVYRTLEILVGILAGCLVDYVLAERAPQGTERDARPGLFARPLDRNLATNAISGGIAIAAIPSIWESLQLPALGQTPITAVIILISMQSGPHWKAATRAFGCLLGAAYGLLAMKVAADAMLPWLVLMGTGLFISAQVHHRGGEASYVGLQAGVAIIMAMVQGMGPSPDILPAIDRLAGIFGGIVVVAITQPLLAPLVRRALGWNGTKA